MAANVQDDHNVVHMEIRYNAKKKSGGRKKEKKNVIPSLGDSKLKQL
jgi:hypothetical protein